jgi:hypothetical protein
MTKKILLQLRYSYDGLMASCNEYLNAFDSRDYYKRVVYLLGRKEPGIASQIPAEEVLFLELSRKDLRRIVPVKAVKAVRHLLRDRQVHIVLAHRYKSMLFATLAAWRQPPRLILGIVHNFREIKHSSRRLLAGLFWRNRFPFVGVSEALRQDVLKSVAGLSPERVLGLFEGIEIEQTLAALLPRDEARARLGLKEDDLVLGHVGRLVPSKDQPTLLRAFALTAKAMPSARLVIVGEGESGQQLRELADSLGMAERVVFTGAIADAFRFMPAFETFVFTSVEEGFGRVLLEAMAARLPIVATRAGGIPEAIGNVLSLCECGDVEGIARAMHHCLTLSSQQRAEIGDRLFQRLVSHFSSAIFRKKLLAFIAANMA